MRKHEPRRLIRVIDPQGLAALLRGQMERSGLKQQAAAARLKISQQHLSKLLNSDMRALRQSTLERLQSFISVDQLPTLASVVITEATAKLLHAHNAWMAEQLATIGCRHLAEGNGRPDRLLEDPKATWPARGNTEARKRASEIWTEMMEIRQLKDYKAQFQAFQDKISKKAAEPENAPTVRRGYLSPVKKLAEPGWSEYSPRVELALMRVLLPIIATSPWFGGFLERDWRELHHANELGRYLQGALKAEAILLDRPLDLERAQSLAWDIESQTRPPRKKRARRR